MGVKGLGILSVFLLAGGLAYIPWRWPRTRHHTFSQHVAQNQQATLYYIVLFCTALPLLMWFFAGWFVPVFKLPPVFNAWVIAASVTQIACTFVPETKGRQAQIHQALAGVSALCLLPPLWLLLSAPTISTVGQMTVAITLAIMVMLVAIVAAHQGRPKNFLYIQAGYFAAFFGSILVISYL
jgi:hypothetical protein